MVYQLRVYPDGFTLNKLPATTGRSLFLWPRLAHMHEEMGIRCTELQVVPAGLGEAEGAIYRMTHNIGIRIVLPIVVPPADGAEGHRVRRTQGPVTTAHTTSQRHNRIDN